MSKNSNTNTQQPSFDLRHYGDILALATAVAGPLVLYVLTLPRTVVLEDDGLFLMVGEHLGIAHPPGYPLYTLIIHLFMQLPFGNPAFLGHLSSAVLGALACGALYVCARLLGASLLPALTAAWLLAASEHFWSQAIIAEVYTLNALMFFVIYALLLHGVRHPQQRWLWMAAVVYGLSLANHWPLMGLAFPGLVVAVMPVWREVMGRLPLLGGVALGSAALPYGWMVWRSQQEPLISFHGPIESWSALWNYISRQNYSHVDVQENADWNDRFSFLQWFGNELLWQLTLPGFVLAVLGLILLFQRRQLAAAWSGVLVFLGNGIVLIVLLAFDYDFHRIAIFRPYSLVSYGIVALWLAVGLQSLLNYLSLHIGKRPHDNISKPWFRTGAAVLVGSGMLVFSLLNNWSVNDRSRDDFVANYVTTLFKLLPHNAVLVVGEDLGTPIFGYAHLVEEQRPDITLINAYALIFRNRLFSPHLPAARRNQMLHEFAQKTARPIFYVVDEDKFPHQRGTRLYGLVKEVLRGQPTDVLEFHIDPVALAWFLETLDEQPVNSWNRFLQITLLHKYGQLLGYLMMTQNHATQKKAELAFVRAESNFFSLMGMAEVLLARGNASYWPRVGELLDKAKPLLDESLEKWRRARFFYLQGVLLGRQGKVEQAVSLFEKSWHIHPDKSNPAQSALAHHGITPP